MSDEHIQAIRKDFASMQAKEDFLNLLNSVKGILYGEKSIPFETRHLNYHINPELNKRRYHQYQIKKKSGGERTICAPCSGLKEIQNCLNIVFQALYTPHKNAYGFVPTQSIVDHAKNHVGNIYIYNIDLKNFFPSIDQARIWGRLKYPPFNLNGENDKTKIANMIASLCCHEMEVERQNDSGIWEIVSKRVLPQGAPTSPFLTNIICERLDYLLTGVAKRFSLRYSRYADDLTFSSMHNVYQKDSDFLKELERIIKEQGFAINQSKTRLQKTGYRQEVTGLIVSDRVNVQKRYVKQIRKWLYYWETYGYDRAYGYFLPKYMEDKGHVKRGKPDMTNVLAGKLEFLKMVKGYENPTYLKLNDRFEKLVAQIHSGGFITSILNVWEKEGIEKAMEVYEKATAPTPTPVEDVSEKNVLSSKGKRVTLREFAQGFKDRGYKVQVSTFFEYTNKKGEKGIAFYLLFDGSHRLLVGVNKKLWATVKAGEFPNRDVLCWNNETDDTVVYGVGEYKSSENKATDKLIDE